MNKTLSLILFSTALLPAFADNAEADAALRAGDALQAYTLSAGETGDAADFRRGRALLAMERPAEALGYLQKVSESSPLYPYAAKAQIYAAWQYPSVDFISVVTPFTVSRNAELATLATAALAEYHIIHGGENTAFDLLQSKAAQQPQLKPLVTLLKAKDLRRKGQLKEAEQLCRSLMDDRSLPTAVRHRATLTLSEVYYDREAEEDARTPEEDSNTLSRLLPVGQAEEDDDDDTIKATAAHGTGEETLLYFISTNPDSPLVSDALRRLNSHHAFEKGEYARSQLKIWAEDSRKPARAVQALAVMQQLNNTHALRTDTPFDTTWVNTAAAQYPQEPLTAQLLLEQARVLADRGEKEEAARYLQMVPQDSALKHFIAAQLLPETDRETAHAFLQCADETGGMLRTAALTHALESALLSGQSDLAHALIEQHPADAAALLPIRIAYCQAVNEADVVGGDVAAAESTEAADSPDWQMDRVWLALHRGDAAQAKELLQALPQPEEEAQKMRYFGLKEAADHLSGTPHADTIADLQKNIGNTPLLQLHLADLLAEEGRHNECLALLESMIERKDLPAALLPRVLFRAARAGEDIGTLAALKHAAEVYEHCAAADPTLARRAAIRRAAIFTRVGKQAEALQLLPPVQAGDDSISMQEQVLQAIVRSTALLLQGTESSIKAAADETGTLLTQKERLNRRQLLTLLLHHGAICARSGNAEQAVRDFREVFALKSPTPDTFEWAVMFAAAAGAVDLEEQTGHPEEAAALAEEIATWAYAADPERTAVFAKWATHIRRVNFLKAKN